MSTPKQTANRRRNGLLEACEPCRKRKLACDHAVPICSRCTRRNISSSCVYIGTVTKEASNISTALPQATLNASATLNSPVSAPRTNAGGTTTPGTASMPDPMFGGSSGFLGPTSFSAVFSEHRSRLFTPDSSLASTSSPAKGDVVDEEMVRLGARILDNLPDQTTCEVMMARHKHARTPWGTMWLEHCMVSFWSTFGQHLSSTSRRISSLEPVSRAVSQNSIVPLEMGEDYKDWLDATTGLHLRWEMLGVLFTRLGYGALSAADDDEIFAQQQGVRRDRVGFATEMLKLAEACANLCERTRLVNVLSVLQSYCCCLLETVINGDSSVTAWRMHQEMIAVTTFSGIHRDRDGENDRVTFLSQFRRRLFSSVYDLDKSLAIFTGRPPGLTWRHACCALPLDISDESLMNGGEELHLAIEALDEHGWNKTGQFYPATRFRACVLVARIRDEILEIALDTETTDMLPRINELRARSHAQYAAFPLSVVYRHDTATGALGSEDSGLFLRMIEIIRVAMDHLQNHFLIERLALKWGQTDTQTLVDISRQTVEQTVMLWTQRDLFHAKRYNLEWMALGYGAPASGILCVELLKNHTSTPNFPRSEVIQNLTLFAAFLSWVRPSAPNADLCRATKNIISRVLDQVLNNPPETGELNSIGLPETWDIDMSLWDDVGNFGLLDTYDCFRGTSWLGGESA